MTKEAMANLAATPQAYQRGAILAASPAELVVMLYDGARRWLRVAGAAMEAGEIERAHITLRYAEMILTHLDATLDREQGQVAHNLSQLYVFCLRHLNQARMSQDPAMLAEVSAMLGELRDAWAQIAAEAPGA
jgi:flagellar protein FliS